MKYGDLVSLKHDIAHTTGFYKPGMVGIIVRIKKPIVQGAGLVAAVRFGDNNVLCHQRELEVLSPNRGAD
tara:strand:- start:2181 stop:2390 length:210 start_codon:yes stop_codon:yes gene_type:complete